MYEVLSLIFCIGKRGGKKRKDIRKENKFIVFFQFFIGLYFEILLVVKLCEVFGVGY